MEEELEVRNREAFERLWIYRQVYAYRSQYDSDPGLSVDAAVAYGELLLRLNRSHYSWSRQIAQSQT